MLVAVACFLSKPFQPELSFYSGFGAQRVIGGVAKPMVGLADAFTDVMDSIGDIAKSVNLLEANFKPIERYRLPYVFTIKQTLLPFNQVNSRSAQLLLAHPLTKKARKGDEVIVVSEALLMGNGLEQYVVVTTLRVVLFRVKVVDGQGFITVNLVWQLHFRKGRKIVSSVGQRGHNGSVLYCQKREHPDDADVLNHSFRNRLQEVPQLPINDEDRQDDYFFVESEKKINREMPKSFYPLGPTTSAFKRRAAWPFAATANDGVTTYAVEGEFRQCSQLFKIHNAICCLSGDLNSVINEADSPDEEEGVTTFGPLMFERPQQNSEIKVQNDKDDFCALHSWLEQAAWVRDGLFHETTSLFSEVSKSDVSLPPLKELTHGKVSQVISELDHTARSSLDLSCQKSETGFSRPTSKKEDAYSSIPHNRDLSTFKQNSFEEVVISAEYPSPLVKESSHDLGISHNLSNTLREDPISKFPLVKETSLQEELPKVDESLPGNQLPTIIQCASATLPSLASTPKETRLERCSLDERLDERLQRVEAMLENLVDSFPPTGTQAIQNEDGQPREGSDLNPLTSEHSPQEPGVNLEIEALQEVIKDLKERLAAKNDDRLRNKLKDNMKTILCRNR